MKVTLDDTHARVGESEAFRVLHAMLTTHLDRSRAESLLQWALKQRSIATATLDWGQAADLVRLLEPRIRTHLGRRRGDQVVRELQDAIRANVSERDIEEISVSVRGDEDLMSARRTAHALALRLGMGASMALRVATAVSELSRIMITYAGIGEIRLIPLRKPRVGIRVVASETGDDAAGRCRPAGYSLELGVLVATRLMDDLVIDTASGNTVVTAVKYM